MIKPRDNIVIVCYISKIYFTFNFSSSSHPSSSPLTPCALKFSSPLLLFPLFKSSTSPFRHHIYTLLSWTPLNLLLFSFLRPPRLLLLLSCLSARPHLSFPLLLTSSNPWLPVSAPTHPASPNSLYTTTLLRMCCPVTDTPLTDNTPHSTASEAVIGGKGQKRSEKGSKKEQERWWTEVGEKSIVNERETLVLLEEIGYMRKRQT